MKKNKFQYCLEDRTLLLLEEAGGFFFILSIILAKSPQPWLVWSCIIAAAALEIGAIIRYFLLLDRKLEVKNSRFPRFILVWQSVFFGLIVLTRRVGNQEIITPSILIACAIVHIIVLSRETLRSPLKEEEEDLLFYFLLFHLKIIFHPYDNVWSSFLK